MLRFLLPLSLALGFTTAVVLAPAPLPNAGFERRETARLHAHFAHVLEQLRARDVSGWSEARRADRRRLLALLESYDRAGRFPHNEGHDPGRTPIFVDRHGTRCAMAYLIERSDGAGLVARIAATANLARIRDLAGDAELSRRLAHSGLDLEEAALIQPAYDPPDVTTGREDHVPDENIMQAGVFLSVGFGVPAVFMNIRPRATAEEQRQVRALAILVGAEGLTIGLVDAFHDGHLRGSGLAQLSIGATALTLALLNRFDGAPASSRSAFASPRPRATPIVRAGAGGETQLGLAMAF